MYQHTTLTAALGVLSACLSDPSQRFYTAAEQYAAIIESLRIWNVLTSQDRARGFVVVSGGTSFYQLATTLKDANNVLLRPQTLRDIDLYTEILTQLMENNLQTDMFTPEQIVGEIQQSRDQFLSDTACVLGTRTGDVVAAGFEAAFDYPETVINVRRVVWLSSDGRYIPLAKSDERSISAFNRLWKTPGRPNSYSVAASPALRMRIIPPPMPVGSFNSVVVSTGPAFGVPIVDPPTLLGIPDDYAWAVKYGAMASLLASDGPSSDASRAKRCSDLYALGVELCKKMSTVLHAELDGIPVLPSSIWRTDRLRGGWEGQRRGAPNTLSMVGPDLIALTPVPDARPHSLQMEVVRNTDIPNVNNPSTTYLQVGREQLDAILGMAQWICMFKLGDEDLKDADPMLQQFLDAAQHYGFQRSALSSALSSMRGIGSQPVGELPYEIDASAGTRNADEVRQERNARRRSTAS